MVGKPARIVGEVAVFKRAAERTQDIDDTVRRVTVEIDHGTKTLSDIS